MKRLTKRLTPRPRPSRTRTPIIGSPGSGNVKARPLPIAEQARLTFKRKRRNKRKPPSLLIQEQQAQNRGLRSRLDHEAGTGGKAQLELAIPNLRKKGQVRRP